MSTRSEPVGGPLATPAMKALLAVFGLGALGIVWRLGAGLGAATALNDGYPWGLWIAFDVVTGTALACGGYAVAILVYVLNKGRYHALVRPALLTSALGYTMAGIGINLDIGRWWMVWKVPLYFWHWNFNSALLEVALCVMAYIVVLWIELSPAILEKLAEGAHGGLQRFATAALPVLKRSMVWIVALGLVLPTMHQSSLGTLMLLSGSRLHPLWRSPLLPAIFLLSCVAMGYAVVVFEAAFSSLAFKRSPDISMLAGLAAAIAPLQVVVVAMRLIDLAWRGDLRLLVALDARSIMALLEIVLFLVPVLMLATTAQRRDLGNLVRASMVMMFAGALYRFDTYLVAFNPGSHWAYFPSVPEMVITLGLVAGEVIAYIAIVKTFPILAGRIVVAERQAV